MQRHKVRTQSNVRRIHPGRYSAPPYGCGGPGDGGADQARRAGRMIGPANRRSILLARSDLPRKSRRAAQSSGKPKARLARAAPLAEDVGQIELGLPESKLAIKVTRIAAQQVRIPRNCVATIPHLRRRFSALGTRGPNGPWSSQSWTVYRGLTATLYPWFRGSR